MIKQQTYQDMVKEFHTVFGSGQKQPFVGSRDNPLFQLRKRLIKEEYTEVMEADNPEAILKELADLVYVAFGMAVTYGWNLDEAFKRVHKSNMSKLDKDGKPIYREDGKVLKGPDYKEASMEGLT